MNFFRLILLVVGILCFSKTYAFSNKFSFKNYSTTSSIHYSNAIIFIEEAFVLNHVTSFTNCELYFGTNAKFSVQRNTLLRINNCILKSFGNTMWDGIYASDPSAQIIIDGGTIQDMENGIVVSSQGN